VIFPASLRPSSVPPDFFRQLLALAMFFALARDDRQQALDRVLTSASRAELPRNVPGNSSAAADNGHFCLRGLNTSLDLLAVR
jgi:hypothetical protein